LSMVIRSHPNCLLQCNWNNVSCMMQRRLNILSLLRGIMLWMLWIGLGMIWCSKTRDWNILKVQKRFWEALLDYDLAPWNRFARLIKQAPRWV
jgi:hypothetical protein